MTTQCDPIILEAKRVILKEQLDKISNLALSNINVKRTASEFNHAKSRIKSNDSNSESSVSRGKENDLTDLAPIEYYRLVYANDNQKGDFECAESTSNYLADLYCNQKLVQKYFQSWVNFSKRSHCNNVKYMEDKAETANDKGDKSQWEEQEEWHEAHKDNEHAGDKFKGTEHESNKYKPCKIETEKQDKLEAFIKYLEKYKHKQQECQSPQLPHKITAISRGHGDNKKKLQSRSQSYDRQDSAEPSKSTDFPTNVKIRQVKTADPESFKNRYQAQKNIIEMQKMKLEEQEKMIEALKLGKVQETLHKSMENAKNNIRDIFQNASTKVKCKLTPILTLGCPENILELSSQKAPKIIQEMEKRAEERALRRQVTLERKRIIDEQRRKAKEYAIEQKRVQDEEEKRRNLEAMKERRRKDVEMEKKRQLNRQKWEQLFRMAETHYNNKLKRRCFFGWINVVIQVQINTEKCIEIYELSLMKKCMTVWVGQLKAVEQEKNAIADALYNKKLAKKVFSGWVEVVLQNKRSMQVAADFYDMRLETKTFVHWHRYVCTQYMVELKNTHRAQNHYKRRLLFHCFHQWKSLPTVLQLEKAKEEKRKKWREKVWEVLPDYEPPKD